MSKMISMQGESKNEVKLPSQFNEEYRPDLIRRAVLALQSHKMQPRGTKIGAGSMNADYVSKRRREYKGTYGIGQSRTPRKTMARKGSRFTFVGANVPHAVGGRVAHPPRVEKVRREEINDKERKKAIRSAISATAIKNIVESRGHLVQKLKEFPIIIEEKIESVKKAKEVDAILNKIGLADELIRTKEKKVRAGKGKRRGRMYKKKIGPLFVVSKKCELMNAAKNIAGIDVYLVKDLNAEILAPGAMPGRVVIWSESAIKLLGEKKLFM